MARHLPSFGAGRRNALSVVAGLMTWVAVAAVAGAIMRQTWPAYASITDPLAFTLPMMLARLSIGAVASVAMGSVSAYITPTAFARLLPGLILLIVFIPVHRSLWDKFPVWYHLTFLLTLVPLTSIGNALVRGVPHQHPAAAT